MTTIKLKNGSGAPTAGDLAQGEPALDLTNKRLYTENASGDVIEVGTNPTSVTTGDITATGTATFAGLATTADVSFGDNNKAVFGAGSDLQIYHTATGNHSIINESGGGDLQIQANKTVIQSASGADDFLTVTPSAGVELSHNASGTVGVKLATTSTGVDVTGTVTADGFQTDTANTSFNLLARNSTNTAVYAQNGGTGPVFEARSGSMSAGQGDVHLKVDNNGDISFYEDTGTTAKLFWDASAESLGIGTSSPQNLLHVNKSDSLASAMQFTNSTTGATASDGIFLGLGSGEQGYFWNYEANDLIFGTSNTERMRIDSSGNVEIGSQDTGTASSKQLLSLVNPHGNTGAAAQLWLSGTNATTRGAYIEAEAQSSANQHDLIFATSAVSAAPTERMRIDSDGDMIMKGGRIKVRENDDGNDAVVITRDADEGYVNLYSSGSQTVEIRGNGDSYFNGGNVGIGTNTSLANGTLNVESNGTSVLQARSDTAGVNDGDTTVVVSRAVNSTAGKWANAIYRGYSHAWSYGNNAATTEAMRIDSSGNLLVGTTNEFPYASNTITGFKVFSNGTVTTSASATSAILNTLNDGAIIDLRKDGSTVGSIGVESSDNFYIADSNNTGLNMKAGLIIPSNSDGSTRDAAIDLGASSGRFKDLYLSGGVYLGGTGSANHLDDFEEGTWTGTLTGSSTAPSTAQTATGTYTKVGNLVTVNIGFSNKDITGASGNAQITGLPFTCGDNAQGAGWNSRVGSGTDVKIAYIDSDNNIVWVNGHGTSLAWSTTGTGTYVGVTITFMVA